MANEVITQLQAIRTQLQLLNKRLCDLFETKPLQYLNVDAITCDNTLSSTPVNTITQTVPHPDFVQRVQLCPVLNIDPEVVCISNDGGTTILSGLVVYDVSVNPPIASIYLNNIDVTGIYEIVPCKDNVKYDYELVDICVDGVKWTKILIFDVTVSPILVNTIWLDNLNVVVSAPDSALIDNINCTGCSTGISWSYGNDLSNLVASHSYSITKPACCNLILNTSIGELPMIGDFIFMSTETFNCTFTINSITSLNNCDLTKVVIIGNKIK